MISNDRTNKIFGCWRCCSFSHRKNAAYFWIFECTNCGSQITKQASEQKLTQKCQHCYGLPAGQSGYNILLANYKRRCNGKKKFELTLDQFKHLTQDKCFYCGVKPFAIIEPNRKCKIKQSSRWGRYIYNGIDRIDNKLGYTIKNCVSCCVICNRAKKAMTQNQFIEYIRRIVGNAKINEVPCLSQRSD